MKLETIKAAMKGDDEKAIQELRDAVCRRVVECYLDDRPDFDDLWAWHKYGLTGYDDAPLEDVIKEAIDLTICSRCNEQPTIETIEGWVDEDDDDALCPNCQERHPSGCICADCSGAELTAEND